MHNAFSKLLRAGFLIAVSVSAARSGIPGDVPTAIDLEADGRLAARQRLPIMLMVSQHHCPFCEKLKAEVVRPMIISGDYDEKVIIRELIIDIGGNILSFSGNRIDSAEFAHGYGVFFTPTLLFLDAGGQEISERIVGITTLEMFSYYVDRAIETALAKIKRD